MALRQDSGSPQAEASLRGALTLRTGDCPLPDHTEALPLPETHLTCSRAPQHSAPLESPGGPRVQSHSQEEVAGPG